jgi:hypothetical protein
MLSSYEDDLSIYLQISCKAASFSPNSVKMRAPEETRLFPRLIINLITNSNFKEKTMKHLRQLCVVTLLAVALSSTALAGDIDLPGIVSPPSPPTTAASGDTGAPGAGDSLSNEVPAVDRFTEATFTFWHDVLWF